MKFSPQDSSRAQVMVKEDTSRQHHCFCCFCCFFCCCCTVTMDRPHENGGVVFSIINLIWSHFSVSHLIPKINEVEIDIKESLWKSWKTKSWILGWMDMYTYVHIHKMYHFMYCYKGILIWFAWELSNIKLAKFQIWQITLRTAKSMYSLLQS